MKHFEFLTEIIADSRDFKDLYSALENKTIPALCTGLSSVSKAVLISALAQKEERKITVITSDEGAADQMTRDLAALGVRICHYPLRDYAFLSSVGRSREYEHKRIHTLSALADGDFDVLVMSSEACAQFTMPKKVLKENSFTIKRGDTIELSLLTEKLVSAGYVKSESVEGSGQFSVRGSIVDVFTTGSLLPFRIEFWADEIDTISFFEIETQRRTENADSIVITPATEVLCSKEKLTDIIKRQLEDKKISEKRREVLYRDLEEIQADIFSSFDRYLPFIYEKNCGIFDYIENSLFLISESSNIREHLKNVNWQLGEDISALLEKGVLGKESEEFIVDEEKFYSFIGDAVILDNFAHSNYPVKIKTLLNFNIKHSSLWNGDIDVLKEDLEYILSKKGKAVVLAGGEKAAQILAEDLSSSSLSAVYKKEIKELTEGVTVTIGSLSGGFQLVSENFMLISGRNSLSASKKKVRHIKNSKSIGSLDELKSGDYVVHASHGIGVFCGIQNITTMGVTKDYIKIRYLGQDILYVPVTQLDLVSRYIGAANDSVKLNKLGSSEWSKTRNRVKKAVKDMAEQLTALYKKRMSAKGYSFSADTDLQNNFERRFPFEETEDQLRCIDEIKRDMEKPVPMDRLLCGDVGFGKTEVALRAAFKCICDGKQCAILVPTTILAWQHFSTAMSRIGELPVNVKLLSRFVSKNEQQKTVSEIKKGRVDLVIGTHRMISKDVTFKDLGLVIIDEEQRFGVAQKERLKELYPSVDILTLSATPIPRTLNMAMSGLRDMSSIEEAPGDRHPVQTYVLEQNNSILIDAIKKELRRSGQVYYLHNRVETITRTALKIKEAFPEARVEVAHGKMSEDELSSVWQRLMEREIDILVCTTIIETGIDLSNVNTLIIEDADRMGLSQLHQLRGRVGRSSRRAYAYFCFKRGKVLKEDAVKRLEAIREYTQFGSGFKIAMRDLEIRGAGSILGGAQHGNMEAVGYDMYLKLLGEAMEEKEENTEKKEAVCTIDLNIPAHIPENYISSLSARLGIYKRIADIENDEDVSDVIDELCDRFGSPPKTVMGLIDIALLRNKAMAGDIYEIVREKDSLLLKMSILNRDTFLKLGKVFGERMKLMAGESPVLSVKLKRGQILSDIVKEIVKAL